jgi:hypothetical protein
MWISEDDRLSDAFDLQLSWLKNFSFFLNFSKKQLGNRFL